MWWAEFLSGWEWGKHWETTEGLQGFHNWLFSPRGQEPSEMIPWSQAWQSQTAGPAGQPHESTQNL